MISANYVVKLFLYEIDSIFLIETNKKSKIVSTHINQRYKNNISQAQCN